MFFSKNTWVALTAGLGLMTTTSALAQTQPSPPRFIPPYHPDVEMPAGPYRQTDVKHTGTDLYTFTEAQTEKCGGQILQAMVWDEVPGAGGEHAYFAWAIDELHGPNQLGEVELGKGRRASDPDVVMAMRDGQLYADVVYLVNDNDRTQTVWEWYIWEKCRFNLVGSRNVGGAVRDHSHPNIDANADGEVGIVWQESMVAEATITVSSVALPNSPYTYTEPYISFADSYVLPGYANGDLRCPSGGTSGTSVLVSTTHPAPPPVLFNQALHPDVAVGLDGLTSVSYIHSYAKRTSSPVLVGNDLVVRQMTFEGERCVPDSVDGYTWPLSGETRTVAIPRIAASAREDDKRLSDVEVVLSWHAGVCEEGYGPRNYREIHNFGKSQGAWRDGHTVVSIPRVRGTDTPVTYEPVVSYYSNRSKPGLYVVEWTANGYGKDGEGDALDVWSRSLVDGVRQFDSPPTYSRVNDKNHLRGNQHVPSVAGRFSPKEYAMAHLFADAFKNQLLFKLTFTQAGDGALSRPTGGAAAPTAVPGQLNAVGRIMQAYPNPSSAAVDFKLHLRAGETVQQLVVVDMLGRVVEKLPVPASPTAELTITWQPKRVVPEGAYQVKLVTNQRTETLAISRKQ
ncbi:MAG: T9SS type A sorting domain-containing protein [Hymenobacteraceae bacterium]|nr:T9SS type A sorting domain-containing protein [Hymenobacteraceae bacterium]